MSSLKYTNFYLVGIKGVAMTALAQILVDAGKIVSGCDVLDDFVTQPQLDRLALTLDIGFDHELPSTTECVIFTAAHLGPDNPLVQSALKRNIPVFSQAEAFADWFNSKDGISVAGTSGKSTTTAMIAWILEYNQLKPSYAVGVGDIPNLGRTGRWQPNSRFFVAEADEYVTDPRALKKGLPIVPRFSYLKSYITVCTNLQHEHIDVYPNFESLQSTFKDFFQSNKKDGLIVIHGDNTVLKSITQSLTTACKTFGESESNDFRVSSHHYQDGKSVASLSVGSHQYQLTLLVPGKHNILNAAAAVAACSSSQIGLAIPDCLAALAEFKSTKRRFEYLGQVRGVDFYDDYGHHPQEVAAAITTFKELFSDRNIVVAFQPHTYSRTKAFFSDFVTALATAPNLVLLDIFASAREQADSSVSSVTLAEAIKAKGASTNVTHLHSPSELAQYIQTDVPTGSVMLTLGAGDIYQTFNLLTANE